MLVTVDRHYHAQLQEKVDILEQSLSHVVHEFDSESKQQHQLHLTANENSHGELQRLHRVVELKSKEMNKVNHTTIIFVSILFNN